MTEDVLDFDIDKYQADGQGYKERQLTFAEARAACFNKILGPVFGYGIIIKIKGAKVRSYYYWEFVIYIQKLILLTVIIFWDNQKPGM